MPVEAIDIIFAHKDGERVCNRLHGNADLARFCPIDSDARFRAVEREVTVDKGKQTTAPGCAFDFLHLRVNRREIVRRAADHLDWQTAASCWQGRWLECRCIDTSDRRTLSVDFGLNFVVAAVTLCPFRSERYRLGHKCVR